MAKRLQERVEWSDAEFVLRNWPHYTWLSGDSIAEQAVLSLDMMSWVLGDKSPSPFGYLEQADGRLIQAKN